MAGVGFSLRLSALDTACASCAPKPRLETDTNPEP